MLSVGDVLDGSYRIISRIGDGGAGVVFLGYHLRLNKYVVVKKLRGSGQISEYPQGSGYPETAPPSVSSPGL